MRSRQTVSKLKLCMYCMNVEIKNGRPEDQDINADTMDAQEKWIRGQTATKSKSNVAEKSESRIRNLMGTLHIDRSIMVGTP